jgi:hypothetical protein
MRILPFFCACMGDAHRRSKWQADAMNANGLTNNIPEQGDSTPPGNNALRMCKKGY